MCFSLLIFISYLSHSNIALHTNRKPWLHPNPNYDANKPFHFKFNNPKTVDIQAHDKALIENWNNVIKHPKDRVYILGDLAFRNHLDHLKALNGNKILIKGNHDKMNQECYDLFKPDVNYFQGMQKECHSVLKQFKNDNMDLTQCSENLIRTLWAKFLEFKGLEDTDQMTTQCYNLFAGVHEMGFRTKINGIDITLCHYGLRTWASSIHGAWHLYGHSHGRLPEHPGMLAFDVGVDVWDYTPVPWEVIVEKMRRIKEAKVNDKNLDGETLKALITSSDFNQRIIETRKNNYAILKDMGIAIKYPEMLEV